MKKKNEIKYGIEITKPHSKDMYSHNDMVAKEMKFNIRDAWANEVIKFNATDEWPTEGKIVDIQKGVCAVGYGEGYTIEEVQKDFLQELDNMANWQLHEEYSYMCFKEMVPRTSFMMLGFEWQKHEYDGRFASNGEMTSPVLESEGYDGALNENFDGREEYYK
tara:strand:+ start:111 stop:599 length:489 start_codon:yes stop_codon:yes gene_type:complete